MAHDQPVLVTPRLRLRPFRLHDVPQVALQAGAREVADSTLTIPHPYPAGAAAEWIATHAPRWEDGTGAVYAIAKRETDELIGAINLIMVTAHAQAEIGYWIGHAHWGNGYCTEAGRVLLELGFGMLGLHRIGGRHLVRNPASGRVMTKLGMRFEGIHREAVRKWGRFEDIAHHAILATDRPSAAIDLP